MNFVNISEILEIFQNISDKDELQNYKYVDVKGKVITQNPFYE